MPAALAAPISTLTKPNRFQQQATAFLQAVANKTAPVVTGADGLAVMAVIDAAYQSAAQGAQVLVG